MWSLPFYSYAVAEALAHELEAQGRKVALRKRAGRWHVVEG